MWQRRQQAHEPGGVKGRLSVFFLAAMACLLTGMTLSGCGPDAHAAAAQQSKAKLDAELQHARHDLGIPDTMLKPVETQEHTIAAGTGGWNYNYQNADANYTLLYSQLTGIEQTASQTLKSQTEKDIDAFTTALNTRRGEGFSESNAYQARLDQVLKDFANAKTPGDFATVDATVQTQTGALNALWPAYLKLQDFKDTLRVMRSSGITSTLGESEYSADLQAFTNASSADRYTKLVGVIDGQIMQMMADQTEALPYIGSAMLSAFQARIDLLQQYGEDPAAFQTQHDADAKTLTVATSLGAYLTLAQTINTQTSAMTLPLVRGKARYDLGELQQLIDKTQSGNPLNAYEYAGSDTGIALVQQEFDQAASQSDYQGADDDINVLLTNLRALLDNLGDSTPASQAHATDLQLMQHYGIMSGKVTIISLREQTARFYENGSLVYWSFVTTGRPERPSPPGLHYAMEKVYHTEFTSGDPPGSPFWYAPTPINYGILYANYGYFLHDAWWRYKFGPGSNLPHWDPLAFDGGSHGCVNFPEDNMAWVYNWTPIGSPILIY